MGWYYLIAVSWSSIILNIFSCSYWSGWDFFWYVNVCSYLNNFLLWFYWILEFLKYSRYKPFISMSYNYFFQVLTYLLRAESFHVNKI
jgi:hypothetical protein